MKIGTIVTLAVILAIIIAIVIAINKITKSVRRTVRSVTRDINSVSGSINLLREIAKEDELTPEIKSVGGATSLYLKQIQSDFPEYHNSDAENAIRTFIEELINIRYTKKSKFEKARVSDKVSLNIDKEPSGIIDNLRFNGISIYNYTKTRDYATVVYRVSVGFDYNSKRVETRYEVDYTLQLRDNTIASKSLKCPNCGGTYQSTRDSECPYCGAGIVRDTILNWVITKSKEIL